MKPKHLIIYILFLFTSSANFLFAQTIEEQMTKSHASCSNMFMNAMDILPQLYRQNAFDSLHRAVDIWERSCYDMPEVKITRMLLDIQESNFTLPSVSSSLIDLLSNYASAFPSQHKMQDFDLYKEPENLFYRFSSAWANALLNNKTLNENEKLICRVLNNEIKNPEKEIRQRPDLYPELTVLEEKNFGNKRQETRLDLAFGTGVWLPTNNLTTLGVHPSFTFQIGVRNMHHQLDAAIQLRYLHSPNPYAIKRDEQLDSTDYYVGYYAGLEYTYYFVSQKRFEVGVELGMGYDAFDFKESPYYYYYDPYYYDPDHFTVGSFNANAGLRFNYYFTQSFYVGLIGRYNGIHYSTGGGTNLSGDAISIDLLFGLSSAKSKK